MHLTNQPDIPVTHRIEGTERARGTDGAVPVGAADRVHQRPASSRAEAGASQLLAASRQSNRRGHRRGATQSRDGSLAVRVGILGAAGPRFPGSLARHVCPGRHPPGISVTLCA